MIDTETVQPRLDAKIKVIPKRNKLLLAVIFGGGGFVAAVLLYFLVPVLIGVFQAPAAPKKSNSSLGAYVEYTDLMGEKPKPPPKSTITYLPTPALEQTTTTPTPTSVEELAPVLAYARGGNYNHTTSQQTPQTTADKQKNTTALAARLTTTQFPTSNAKAIKNPNMMITTGTLIPCILETAIDSNLPGFVRCRVTRDIYSVSGKVVLVDRGSRVVGEYQGSLRQGQNRLFIVWSRLETPEGVTIALNSPAVGPLGRSGVAGKVDNQFFTRFGAAIMLSMIDYGGNLLTQRLSKSKTNINIGGSINSAANTALDSSINVPVILKKRQGELVQIYVAQDLNFTDVYELTLTHGK